MDRARGVGLAAVVAAGLALGLAGCQLTRQNYQSVSLGMPAERVEQILGAPRYRFADEWVYTRDDPRDLVQFVRRRRALVADVPHGRVMQRDERI